MCAYDYEMLKEILHCSDVFHEPPAHLSISVQRLITPIDHAHFGAWSVVIDRIREPFLYPEAALEPKQRR